MGTKFPTRDGTCIRDYVHVTDLVDAHVAVAPHVANPPVLYNVGTGAGVTVKEFVNSCLKVTGAKIKVKVQDEPRPGDYAEVYASVSKIQKDLNWTARYTDFEESMKHAWSWRQQHVSTY
jgi:UDP-arabinose 4-epimerase